MSPWGVVVDETRLHAVGRGVQAWFWYRRQVDQSTRPAHILKVSFTGETVWLERDDEQAAHWLADWLVAQGFPRAAVSVRQRPQGVTP